MKKFIIGTVMFILFAILNSTMVFAAVEATDTTVKINDTTRTYDRVIFISPTGDDVTGNGTKENPFASYYEAEKAASADGDCIYFEPGEYILDKVVLQVPTYLCYFGSYKHIDVIGSGKDTILYVDQSQSKARDNGIVFFSNDKENFVSNMQIKFDMHPAPGPFPNANVGVLAWARSTISNVYFENIGNVVISYGYFNSVSGYPKVDNCIFKIGGSIVGDYSGKPIYTNTLFSVKPTNGTINNFVARAVTDDDLDFDLMPEDLKNKGIGTNPDGTQAHYGVYGGEFAWDTDPSGPIEPEPDKLKLSVLLEVDEEVQLSVSDLIGENTSYTWTSTDNDVATVDANGKVTAIKEGTTAIYAENVDKGFSEYINVKVVGGGQAAEIRLAVDLNTNRTAKLYISDDDNIVWTSFDESVVTVGNTGEITGVSKGLAIVQAEVDGTGSIIYVRVR